MGNWYCIDPCRVFGGESLNLAGDGWLVGCYLINRSLHFFVLGFVLQVRWRDLGWYVVYCAEFGDSESRSRDNMTVLLMEFVFVNQTV